MTTGRHTWTSWSGLTVSHPTQSLAPRDTGEVADAVVAARRHGLRVKMVGTGHSFTDIAATDGLLLRPDRLAGVTAVDRDAMTVTVLAGTPLALLNERLRGLGLALNNMGDIERQTVAGAIATGTHGSGGRWTSLSEQVVALELVTADGTVVTASAAERPDVFEAARIGLGALGVVTSVTFAVEPAFRLQAEERPVGFDDLVSGFDDLVEEHHHVDVHWFPYSDRALVKLNDRTLEPARPLSRSRAYLDDELLANGVFGGLNRLADGVPRAVPALNRLSARGLSRRSYVDESSRVFVAARRVRFREMEYAVPRETAMSALTEARRLIERERWHVTFPVEVRFAHADDLWLSQAHARDSVFLAFHVNARTDHRPYFGAVEHLMREYDGRPHWGKLHTRDASTLAPAYPRWADFLAVRKALDPDHVFGNAYLDRVLGA